MRGGLKVVAMATTLFVSLTTACTSSGRSKASSGSPSAARPADVAIVGQEYSYQAPSTLDSGINRFVFTNAGKAAHGFDFARLNDGVTLDKLKSAVSAGDRSAFETLTTYYGGTTVDAGATAHFAVDMKPGSYLIFSSHSQGEQGPPDIVKGMFAPITVGTAASAFTAPSSAGTIGLRDFAFDLPANMRAGVYEVVNHGAQTHEIDATALDPGKTVDDLRNLLATPGGPPQPPSWAHDLTGGLFPIAPGVTAWVQLDLAPATHYVFLCFVSDHNTHAPHAAEGMVADLPHAR